MGPQADNAQLRTLYKCLQRWRRKAVVVDVMIRELLNEIEEEKKFVLVFVWGHRGHRSVGVLD
jgi:hypothetical protein